MPIRTTAMLIICAALASGCGEPVRAVDADARAAKAQARDAVRVAQDAAARVDELSRAQTEESGAAP
jgi:hypothetical protein